MIVRVQPRKSTGQQIADTGRAITATFFALCFIALIALIVWGAVTAH